MPDFTTYRLLFTATPMIQNAGKVLATVMHNFQAASSSIYYVQ